MYEEGTLRQKLYGETKVPKKSEPICVVTKEKDCLLVENKIFQWNIWKNAPQKARMVTSVESWVTFVVCAGSSKIHKFRKNNHRGGWTG